MVTVGRFGVSHGSPSHAAEQQTAHLPFVAPEAGIGLFLLEAIAIAAFRLASRITRS